MGGGRLRLVLDMIPESRSPGTWLPWQLAAHLNQESSVCHLHDKASISRYRALLSPNLVHPLQLQPRNTRRTSQLLPKPQTQDTQALSEASLFPTQPPP